MQLNDHFYNTYNGSVPHNMNILGGSQTVSISSSSANEVFYKWNSYSVNGDFHPLNAGMDNYYIDKGDVIANFKSKFKSTVPTAISNAPQTKAIKDTILTSLPNGIIHEIHESMGGIFYSRSTDGGSNFSKEEVVNYDLYTNDADGNKNSCITIKRRYGDRSPATTYNENKNVSVVWERYNQNTGNTEIIVSERVNNTSNNGFEWQRTKSQVFCSFASNSNFNSYPKIFVADKCDGIFGDEVIVIPHLRPSGSTTQLVITVYTLNQTLDYIVDYGNTGNITNLAVSCPYNNWGVFGLHIVYQKDNSINNIVYRKINVGYDALGGFYYQEEPNALVENIGAGDGFFARFWPDISVQNGLPVITYRGNFNENRIISMEEELDNYQTIGISHHPINVKYKKSDGTWSSFLTYDGLSQQDNPNIEGSKNATGYLLTFKKNGSHYQFVKIDGVSGYSCSPGVFQGEDAKLVRGSYIGQFSSNYNPMILTLSNLVNSTYTVGKQSFSITNSQNQNQTDGFSNLNGSVYKNETLYNFTLGSIIACNTAYGFEDDVPPQSVHNSVEFNETMTSSVFNLNNNDTLIIGAHGKYIAQETINFTPLVYHVNLIYNSNNQLKRELFSDTIQVSDSVGIDFLRGYIITDIENGTNDFYVQMIIDTVSSDGDEYIMSGMYGDNTGSNAGDNSHSSNTKVFFEKQRISNNLSIPKEYSLSQNYPNPFNPVTNIKYQIPKDGLVTLKVYDITGREIVKLVNEVKQAGNYTVSFNGSNFASGVYFYRIQSGDFVQVKKMILIK